MNVFARIESACARVVEDTFARVFPSALEPAQIARRLVATAQASPTDRYLVRVHPTDYARLAADRDHLETHWSAMLGDTLPERGAIRVVLDEDGDIVAGSLLIEAVTDEAPRALAFERPDGTRVPIEDGMTIGRGDDNGLVVADARASRLHARIESDGSNVTIVDARSSNGTFVDGAQVRRAPLHPGQLVTIGATLLKVVDA